jgi:regulatory protein
VTAAVRLLARREHSQAELRRKLTLRLTGADPEALDDVLAQLAQEGLQSDRRFAEAYVAYRTEQGFGPLRIEAELRERGISAALIDRFLHQSDTDWWACLREFAHRRCGDDLTEGDRRAQARCYRLLLGRGFASGQIRRLLFDD